MKKFTRIAGSLLGLLFALSTITHAQTTYKSDPGFFTPVLESFYLRGGSLISTQKIGPALGYRFNENFDLSVHSEFLFSETDFENRDNEAISLLNLGITGGHTADVSNRFMIRSEISLYQLFVFSKQGLDGFKPSLTFGACLVSAVLGTADLWYDLITSKFWSIYGIWLLFRSSLYQSYARF